MITCSRSCDTPLRAGLVEQAGHWRWSSLHHWRANGPLNRIDSGPVPRPEVNQPPLSAAELEQVGHSVNRGTPYSSADRVCRMAAQLGLSASLRPRGRPRKEMEMSNVPFSCSLPGARRPSPTTRSSRARTGGQAPRVRPAVARASSPGAAGASLPRGRECSRWCSRLPRARWAPSTAA
jgi:hypothetical protein